jgi:hypothetical protein
MPILETNDYVTPRSVLRHRPIEGDAARQGSRSIVTTAATPIVQRASRPRPQPTESNDEVAEWQRAEGDAEDEDQILENRPRTATRRISATPGNPPKTPRLKEIPTRRHRLRNRLRQGHPLLYLGMGMLGMLVLWTILVFLVGWVGTTLDDLRYGRPRTFQIDAVVGHNDSAASPSHFIAINLNGHIEVIEMPGGDASHARIYIGPQLYGANANLVPVTLSFVDVKGDKKPDMIIHFQGTEVVFINDAGGFRPATPEERNQVDQFLQRLGH